MAKAGESLDPWVVIAQLGAPFGLAGWLRIQLFTEGDFLTRYPTCWIRQGGYEVPLTIEALTERATGSVMKILGCDTPEQAMVYRAAELVVPRSALPPLVGPHEFYWVDLEGCEVFCLPEERLLGVIGYLYESVQDVMVVQAEGGAEQHIPFLMPEVVQRVDLQARKVWVDWPY